MKFEYKFAKQKGEGFISGGDVDIEKMSDEYNMYGKDGWELVSVMGTNRSHGETNLVIAVFKRELR